MTEGRIPTTELSTDSRDLKAREDDAFYSVQRQEDDSECRKHG